MSAVSTMNERIERVNNVAQHGNIDEFYNLIERDEKLLDDIDVISYVNTPLHMSAAAGHIPFAMEIMRLKPSFARKPNPNGKSPILLAQENGKAELVHRFLQVDGDLVRVKRREGITLLHYAAETDDLELLVECLSVCPDSIEDVTIRNETALHIALKYDKLDAFKVLVGWLKKNSSKNYASYERKVINWKDEEGNTVLHIAVSKNQTQAVSHLLYWGGVKINVKNLEGKTVWDIFQGRQTQVNDPELRVMLRYSGALTGSSLSTVPSYADYLRRPKFKAFVFFQMDYARSKTLSDERRNVLLLVFALLLTISHDASLSPPGGVWQDDYKPETNETLCNTSAAHLAGSSHPGSNDLIQCNTTAAPAHKAGTAIGLTLNEPVFGLFMFSHSLIFVFSLLMIFILLPTGYLKLPMATIMFLLCTCDLCQSTIIMDTQKSMPLIYYYTVGSLINIILVYEIWKLTRYRLKWFAESAKEIFFAKLGAGRNSNLCQFLFLFFSHQEI